MAIEFNSVVRSIVDVLQELRNWMIGYYIDAFELRGSGRAEYGDQLFAKLSSELKAASLSNCNKRQLYRYTQFFCTYPQIVGTLSPLFQRFLLADRVAYE